MKGFVANISFEPFLPVFLLHEKEDSVGRELLLLCGRLDFGGDEVSSLLVHTQDIVIVIYTESDCVV